MFSIEKQFSNGQATLLRSYRAMLQFDCVPLYGLCRNMLRLTYEAAHINVGFNIDVGKPGCVRIV